MPHPTAPAALPTWATDANYTNGPLGIPGTATKVEPAAGVKAEGHIPADRPPPQWENWWKNLAFLWLTFFKALADIYAWTWNNGVVDRSGLQA